MKKNSIKDNIEVLILAGGKGTRLKSIIPDQPKPMAPIHGIPFLCYLVHHYAQLGFHKFRLLTGYKHKFIENYFRANPLPQIHLSYSQETQPLGTAGAIRTALINSQTDFFLCLNGDSYLAVEKSELDFCFSSLIAFPQKFFLALKRLSHTNRYGAINLDKENRVTGFIEKGAGKGSNLINAGLYCFHRKSLPYFEEKYVSLEREVFPQLIADHRLYGWEVFGDFIDIGIPIDYKRAAHIIPPLETS